MLQHNIMMQYNGAMQRQWLLFLMAMPPQAEFHGKVANSAEQKEPGRHTAPRDLFRVTRLDPLVYDAMFNPKGVPACSI